MTQVGRSVRIRSAESGGDGLGCDVKARGEVESRGRERLDVQYLFLREYGTVESSGSTTTCYPHTQMQLVARDKHFTGWHKS